ncbi:MAG: MmcQ/YjbR family DNA-binding protein [Oscillospiraceae bacterium]|nr:MmcQ/YjbR family DNA-binding protein [Oscillospiraceae bacterium]
MELSLRDEVFRYVKKKYGSEVEYPWPRYPGYAVFRHQDNRKWYGLVMDLPRARLGLPGETSVDVLNVKLDSPLLVDLLTAQEGYFPGYHISRGGWITVLLDGSVPFAEIGGLIDKSYAVTASPQTKKAIRPPKEWLVPSNPHYYDIEHAFDTAREITWKQGAGIKKGDVVFLYVGAPVSAILYKCKVVETDIPYRYRREGLSIRSLMRIRLMKRYDPARFPFELLKTHYGVRAVRGPRGIPEELSAALKR